MAEPSTLEIDEPTLEGRAGQEVVRLGVTIGQGKERTGVCEFGYGRVQITLRCGRQWDTARGGLGEAVSPPTGVGVLPVRQVTGTGAQCRAPSVEKLKVAGGCGRQLTHRGGEGS